MLLNKHISIITDYLQYVGVNVSMDVYEGSRSVYKSRRSTLHIVLSVVHVLSVADQVCLIVTGKRLHYTGAPN